jgi:hypothetical protein
MMYHVSATIALVDPTKKLSQNAFEHEHSSRVSQTLWIPAFAERQKTGWGLLAILMAMTGLLR